MEYEMVLIALLQKTGTDFMSLKYPMLSQHEISRFPFSVSFCVELCRNTLSLNALAENFLLAHSLEQLAFENRQSRDGWGLKVVVTIRI